MIEIGKVLLALEVMGKLQLLVVVMLGTFLAQAGYLDADLRNKVLGTIDVSNSESSGLHRRQWTFSYNGSWMKKKQ